MAVEVKVLVTPKGSYENATVYKPLDMVFYNNDSWIAKQECVGITLTEGAHWIKYSDTSGLAKKTDVEEAIEELDKKIDAIDTSFDASDVVNALGFTPVQQGGGTGQSSNKIKIGWDNSSKLLYDIDNGNGTGVFASETWVTNQIRDSIQASWEASY